MGDGVYYSNSLNHGLYGLHGLHGEYILVYREGVDSSDGVNYCNSLNHGL